ncbi:hypothetical protein CK203_054991 [Vitis vinifera]|uniref:Reverse transcriptase domain-containing protein n=1 Tax=Vitis vinifera TaxID=29760 RepID=A0A438GNC5_VITVI|nr:hypothetical protein CK203_054991 [Vitis vinifera]
MEALSCLLNKAKEGGYLSDFKVNGKGGGVLEISHLLFVDDTLVFCLPLGAPTNSLALWDGVEERQEGWGIGSLGGLTHSTRLFLASGFDVSERYRIGLWKAIRKLWAMFVTKVSFFVGEGKRVKFWKDRWCGSESSCNSFPSLYALASSKKAWVANMWDQSLGSSGC